MKRTPWAPPLLLLSAVALTGTTPSALAGTPQERMTRGKLAADLGDQRAAEQWFADLAADTAAPASARAEALVRLGVVQRNLGKTQASAAAFQTAMQSPARDAEITRLLTLAIAGVAPDRTRWASQWPRVRFATPSGTGGARPVIKWPGPGPQGVRQAFPEKDLATFDLEDVSLAAFLHTLLTNGDGRHSPRDLLGWPKWPDSYQPPAAVEGLDFAIHSGVKGQVTVKVSDMPWNELLENVLASNGLGFVLDNNLLFIARVEDLGAIERVRGRTYRGQPITLNFLNGDLLPMLGGPFQDVTGFRLVADPNLQGTMTVRVSERPAMQVIALLLAANDLAATRIEAPDMKPGATALRICRVADIKGAAVDLSKLVPTANPHP
jgi:hypothetical protein